MQIDRVKATAAATTINGHPLQSFTKRRESGIISRK
jgi:hypothetical protein